MILGFPSQTHIQQRAPICILSISLILSFIVQDKLVLRGQWRRKRGEEMKLFWAVDGMNGYEETKKEAMERKPL